MLRFSSASATQSALQNVCNPHEHWLGGVNADSANSWDAMQ
jgi:hypothetical protein